MTSLVLYDAATKLLWELRSAWASGRRVALTLDSCDVPRMEGTVRTVASTGVLVRVGGMDVPMDRVLAVHLPSRLGDSTAAVEFHGAGRRVVQRPGQLEMAT